MSDQQSSLSKRMHPPDSVNLSSSNGMSTVNKSKNFQMPSFALHNYSSESSLVNGNSSSQGQSCLNVEVNKLDGSYQGNNFPYQSQFSNNIKKECQATTDISKPSHQPSGIPNIQSSPNLESLNLNNRQNINLSSTLPKPPFGSSLSSSDTNLANGVSYQPGRHFNNTEASNGNNFTSKGLTDGSSLMQSASLSSLDKSTPQNFLSPLQANTSNLFPSRELTPGNLVKKSSPHASPLHTSTDNLNSFTVSSPISFSASQSLTSSPLLSNDSNSHLLLPTKVSTESALLKNDVDSFQRIPSTTASHAITSFGTTTGVFKPSSVDGISMRPTIEPHSHSILRPPPSPLLKPSVASLSKPFSASNNSSTIPVTSPVNNPFLSKSYQSGTGVQNIGQSFVSNTPLNIQSKLSQTTLLAKSPQLPSVQPRQMIAPRPMHATAVESTKSFGILPMQSPMFRTSPAPSIPPQSSFAGQLPSSMKGPLSAPMMGPPQSSVIGQPPTSRMGPPPTSMMGPPPASMMGPPPASMMGPPPASMMGPLPASMMGPPPASMMGPPPASMVGSPPTSMMGPPPTSMMGPPPTSMMGPPPTSMMGPPPTSMMGPLPTSMMGQPPMHAMGLYQTSTSPSAAALLDGPTSSMKSHPPISMIGHPLSSLSHHHSTSIMGTPSTSVSGPLATSTIGPPPLSMQAPQRQSGVSAHSTSNIKFPPSLINQPSSNSVLSPPPTSIVGAPSSLPGGSGLNITKNVITNSAGILSSNALQSPVGNSNRYPGQHPPHSSQVNQLNQQLGGLSVTREGWNKTWGNNVVDLLQQKIVLPPQGVVPPKPILLQDYLPNCSPDIFRCTISKVPETQSILQKSRLPFGIVIHPFKDLEHLAVVSCNTIVRCRSCRTYINPFVVFKGERRWECNLCFRVNDLPDEFQFDPLTRTYGDPSRRPEVREATIEFIAPQEYMLRPPQPATYIWVLDVSRQAVETGYLKVVCDTLLNCLDKIPGDRRALIGFITFSTTVQFYLMGEGQKDVQMLDVGEVDDIFIPSPDDLLVHLDESRNLIEELLTSLPETHNNNVFTQTAFGAALTAAHKLLAPIGGRITAMAVTLPTIGPGALKPREDPNQRSAKNISHLGPATDFYKKLALDCSGQQIAVDLFTFNSQYIDLATLSGVSRFSGGCMHHFPGFNVTRNPASVEPFKSCLTRYITRKIGFEAVMRIRTTRGLDITNFHGNFFVRSTDLLSLPNINPDSGFGMQLSIEEPLHNIRQACFQAALLYTSSKGERRIRVHTLCLPVCPNIHEVIAAGDQHAIVDLLAKMAVDRCLSSQMSDAREAIVNTCSDIISAFKASLSSSTAGLPMPASLQALPLYLLGLLKSISLRHGISTKLDDRVFAMFEMKTLPLKYLIQSIYPDLYAISYLSETGAINIDDLVIPQPDHLQLSGEHIDRDGAYCMDVGSFIYVYVRSGISSEWVNDVLGVPAFAAIPQPLYEDPLPTLDNPTSELVRNFIFYLQRNKPFYVPVYVIKEDNPSRNLFLQYLVDDRSEGTHSYVEFLQFIKSLVK